MGSNKPSRKTDCDVYQVSINNPKRPLKFLHQWFEHYLDSILDFCSSIIKYIRELYKAWSPLNGCSVYGAGSTVLCAADIITWKALCCLHFVCWKKTWLHYQCKANKFAIKLMAEKHWGTFEKNKIIILKIVLYQFLIVGYIRQVN